MRTRTARQRRAARLAGVLPWAALCLAWWALFDLVGPWQRLGYWALLGVNALPRAMTHPLTLLVDHAWLIVALASLGVALWDLPIQPRRSIRVRALAGLLAFLALAGTLKRVLPHWEHGWFPHENTMPSGHASAVLAVVLVHGLLWADLAQPPGWGGAVRRALRVAALVLIDVGILAGTSHTAGDILLAISLAGLVGAAAIHAPEPPRARVLQLMAASLALTALGAVLARQPGSVPDAVPSAPWTTAACACSVLAIAALVLALDLSLFRWVGPPLTTSSSRPVSVS